MKHNELSQSVSYGYTSSSARSPYSKRNSDFNKTNDFTSKYKSPENKKQTNDSNNFLRSTMGVYKSRPTEDLYSSQARTGDVKEQFNLRNTTGNLASLMKKFDFDKEQEPTPSKKYSEKLNNINSQSVFKKDKVSYNNTYTAQTKNIESKYDYKDRKKQSSKVQQSSSSARLDQMIRKHQKQQQLKEEIRKLRQQKQAIEKTKSKGVSSLTNLLSTTNFISPTSGYSSNNASYKQPIKAKNPENLFNSYRQPVVQNKYKDFSKKGAYDFTKKQQKYESSTYTPKRQKQSKYDFIKKYQSDKKTSDWKIQDFEAKYQTKTSETITKYSSPQNKQKQRTVNSPSFQKKQTKTQKQVKVTKYFSFGDNKPTQKFDCKVGLRDFQLGKLLGQGKFGNVYQAVHKQTKSLYALKKVPKSIIQSHYMIDQFILEIKLQAYMNHENILAMDGFFHDKEHIYLILQYMEEGTLYSILKKNKTLTIEDAAKKLKQISKGIIYMHENGLAHRDIKPENVVMSHGVCKLCDFGWATICDQRRKTYCGTFDYAAPQILEGTQYDMTVDLWCLGVLAYELLVGKAPFYHIKKEETKKKILNVQSQKITFPSTLPRDAIDFIEKLLKKDPEQRIKVEELLQHPFLAKV